MRNKPIILISVKHYLPGFKSGGPVRSVSNIVRALKNHYNFYIVCLGRDHGVNVYYKNIILGKWVEMDGVFVYYAKNQEVGFNFFREIFKKVKPDMIYLNSLFDVNFSIMPFLAAGFGRNMPILLAPRGELSLGALSLKAWRKKIFLILMRVTNLYKYLFWNATSLEEKSKIVNLLDVTVSQIFLINNLPGEEIVDHIRPLSKNPGYLKIILAARISPMKNTLSAIRIVSKMKGNIEFDLLGHLEDKVYWADCQRLIECCPGNIKVSYKGDVPHQELQSLWSQYHVMLMPTLGENFGHSIFEALSAGLPVIISNRTPWKNLIAAGVGADLPLDDEQEFLNQLTLFEEMTQGDMEVIRNACKSYIQLWRNEYDNPQLYLELFRLIIKSK
jgi:glycosyltransferase involved in cell wall biosynthesis